MQACNQSRAMKRESYSTRKSNFFLKGGDDIFLYMVTFMDVRTLVQLSLTCRDLKRAVSPRLAVAAFVRELRWLETSVAPGYPDETPSRARYKILHSTSQFRAYLERTHEYRDALQLAKSICDSESQFVELLIQAVNVHARTNARLYFLIAIVIGSAGKELLLQKLRAHLIRIRGNFANIVSPEVINVEAFLCGAASGI